MLYYSIMLNNDEIIVAFSVHYCLTLVPFSLGSSSLASRPLHWDANEAKPNTVSGGYSAVRPGTAVVKFSRAHMENDEISPAVASALISFVPK